MLHGRSQNQKTCHRDLEEWSPML